MEDADGVLRNLTLASKLQESTRVAIDNANKNIQEAIDLHDKVSAWCLVQYLQWIDYPNITDGLANFPGNRSDKTNCVTHQAPYTTKALRPLSSVLIVGNSIIQPNTKTTAELSRIICIRLII